MLSVTARAADVLCRAAEQGPGKPVRHVCMTRAELRAIKALAAGFEVVAGRGGTVLITLQEPLSVEAEQALAIAARKGYEAHVRDARPEALISPTSKRVGALMQQQLAAVRKKAAA